MSDAELTPTTEAERKRVEEAARKANESGGDLGLVGAYDYFRFVSPNFILRLLSDLEQTRRQLERAEQVVVFNHMPNVEARLMNRTPELSRRAEIDAMEAEIVARHAQAAMKEQK